MEKVKWDVNHVSVQHSPYIDVMNRNIQTFAMRWEERSNFVPVPYEAILNSLAQDVVSEIISIGRFPCLPQKLELGSLGMHNCVQVSLPKTPLPPRYILLIGSSLGNISRGFRSSI